MKKAKEYRSEIFDEIIKYIQLNENIDDIIIANNYNQNIKDRKVQ